LIVMSEVRRMGLSPDYWPEEIRGIVDRAAAYQHHGMRKTGEPPRTFALTHHEYDMLLMWYTYKGLVNTGTPRILLYGMTCVHTEQYDSEATPLEEWEQAVNATIQDVKARRGVSS
jgi:hypothetical protein